MTNELNLNPFKSKFVIGERKKLLCIQFCRYFVF